jgi:hypothetical protein
VTSAVTPVTLSPAPQLQQPIISKKATEPVLYTNNKCPECKVQFCSKAEVAAHFQEVKPALNTVSRAVRVQKYTGLFQSRHCM